MGESLSFLELHYGLDLIYWDNPFYIRMQFVLN